jgi:hypothetical protein
MSGTTGGANLPVAFKIEGVEQVQRTLRETTQQFVEQARAASSVGPAVTSASDAFERLERRAAAARGVVNDLGGALQLIGAGGAASSLGGFASFVGNLGDAVGVATRAAGAFGTSFGALTALAGPAAVAITGVATAVGLYVTNMEAQEKHSQNVRAAIEAYNQAIEQSNRILQANVAIRRGSIEVLQVEAERTLSLAITIEKENVARANAAASRLVADNQAVADARARGLTVPDRFSRGEQRSNTATQIANDAERASARLAELEIRLTRMREVQYAAPIGPPAPTGGLRDDPSSRDAAREAARDEREFERAEVLARRTAQAALDADKRARDQITRQQQEATERFERASIDAFSRIGENAADRIGTGLVQAFVSGERAALDFGSLARSVFASVLADLAKLAIINPVANGLLGTSRPTLGGAVGGLGGGSGGGGFGGLSDLFTVGSTLDKLTGGTVSSYFGGGGGGIISGIDAYAAMNFPALFSATSSANVASAANLAALTPEALASAGSMESLMALLPASQGSAMGMSLSGLLGGIGAGYGIGSLIGTYVAGDSPARQLNSQIGAGGGAVAGAAIGSIFGPVGTVVGGVIGGAAGGGGGGLIGPGAPTIGGDVLISVDGSGRLAIGGYAGKGFDPSQLVAGARGQVDQLNAQLAAAGLRFNSDAAGGWLPDVGWLGGGASGNPATLSALLGQGGPGLRADDARLQGVLDRFGATGNVEQSLALAAEVQQFTGVLDALKASAAEATDPLAQIRAQFDGLRATAERLGFGLDDVTAAQERAIKQYEDQKREQERAQKDAERNAAAGSLVGTVSGIAAYARGLRTANDNSGNPMSRLAAAESSFFGDAGLALNGNLDALGRITSSAETFRTLSRAVYGTGQGYAATESRIAEALGRIGGIGAEQLTTAAMDAIAARQTDVLGGGLTRLTEEVTKLRDELRQLQGNPLLARAA